MAGYTLDGGGDEIDGETFSAGLAVVTINGINHPALAKGRMVNALLLIAVGVRFQIFEACAARLTCP